MAPPSLDVVQDDEPVEVAAEFVIHSVDSLELLPNAADGVVERHKDAVVVVAGELAARIDAIPGNDAPGVVGLDDDELLTYGVAAAQAQVQARQDVVLVAVDQRQAMLDRGVERR